MERVERCRVGGNCMTGGVRSLDRVGIAVPDLAAAASVYERLGFHLTPLQQQAGPLEPDGPVVAWGGANRCAMLARGYLEILGILDPALCHQQLRPFPTPHH